MSHESPFRMLVTLTNRGAAVERVELNHPRYHEVDNFNKLGGYLGYLAAENFPPADADEGRRRSDRALRRGRDRACGDPLRAAEAERQGPPDPLVGPRAARARARRRGRRRADQPRRLLAGGPRVAGPSGVSRPRSTRGHGEERPATSGREAAGARRRGPARERRSRVPDQGRRAARAAATSGTAARSSPRRGLGGADPRAASPACAREAAAAAAARLGTGDPHSDGRERRGSPAREGRTRAGAVHPSRARASSAFPRTAFPAHASADPRFHLERRQLPVAREGHERARPRHRRSHRA